ncbi:MAG: hypothetical protein AAGE01_07785 [Pseudomonadota bacterium]
MSNSKSVKSLVAGSAVVSSTALPQTWARPLSRADARPAPAQAQGSRPADTRDNGNGVTRATGYGSYL